MKLQSRGQARVWPVVGALVLVATLGANFAISRGASTQLLPQPANIPVPETVTFTDNFGGSMALDGDTLVVGAPFTEVDGVQMHGIAYIYNSDPNAPTEFTLLKSIAGSESGRDEQFGGSVSCIPASQRAMGAGCQIISQRS